MYLPEGCSGLVLGPVVEAEAEVLEVDLAALEEESSQLALALQVEVHELHLRRRHLGDGGGFRNTVVVERLRE